MEIGKTYLVKKDIFGLIKDELWTLFAVLQDGSEENMPIYHHLADYFEEVAHENF